MEVSKADHFTRLYITEIIHNLTAQYALLIYGIICSFIQRVCHDANQEMLRLSIFFVLIQNLKSIILKTDGS
jgi:hypothetical protein